MSGGFVGGFCIDDSFWRAAGRFDLDCCYLFAFEALLIVLVLMLMLMVPCCCCFRETKMILGRRGGGSL